VINLRLRRHWIIILVWKGIRMCFTLLIIMSIVTAFVFVRFDKLDNDALRSLSPVISFAFSWLVIAVLFTVLVETWQIVLSIPAAVREPAPAWGKIVENVLRTAVFLLPFSRMTLALVYSLPLLLVPLLAIGVKRLEMGPALLYSALLNLIFFWLLLLMDNG
jgi:hypothetical protein